MRWTLLCITTWIGSVHAFHIRRPTTSSTLSLQYVGNAFRRSVSSSSRSSSSTELLLFRRMFGGRNGDSGGDGDGDGDDVPFFVDAAANYEKDAGIVEEDEATLTKAATAVVERVALTPQEEAEKLRREAARMKLEAERMDVELTLSKIANLEIKLKKNQTNSEQKIDIQNQIDMLTKKLERKDEKESKVDMATPCNGESIDENNPYAYVPLTKAELDDRIATLRETEQFLLNIVAKAAGLENSNDLKALAIKMHEDQYFADSLLKRESMEVFVPLTSMEIQRLEEGYMRLPPIVREMNERQRGTSNVTEIVMKSFEEDWKAKKNGDKTSKKQEDQSILSDGIQMDGLAKKDEGGGSWLFGDNEPKSREDNYVENMLPKQTRKEGAGPTEIDIQNFIEDVLDINTFTVPSKRGEKVPGGFILRGSPRMEDLDMMIEAIDERLAQSSIGDKVEFFYISDPTPVSDDQMMSGMDRDPVLFVCGRDLSPTANPLITSSVSLITLFFLFSLSSAFFTFNESIMAHFEADQAAGFPTDLDWLFPLIEPLFFSMIGVQFVHEAAHKLVAISKGFDTAFPTLIPSPQLGTLGAITSLKTPAKNRKDLFDFALAGPIAGIVASLAVMYLGLELTAYADDATYSMFPSVPLYFLKQSALGGGLIDNVFGTTLLSAPDLNKLIPVHPFVISGLSSLLINGYSLIPFGRTDGGRLVLSSVGRTGALFEKILALAVLVAASLFSSQTFVLVLVPFLVLFQGQLEIPCRNEVDGIDIPRGILSVATAILV
eukprot:CAMPEP_0116066190 /NCGR_PEP_ID=MMETSP0322-20121206/10235_1 /TAXON_ID=163516 /ORGANISM="Leptocylindrus danicus var. apora, Strain B651" /LENGTH=776 /DNA_ID=CAMNT_0003552697 /DNA_START=177 /DNA_END=2504 /DNA_ORIENTATION=-